MKRFFLICLSVAFLASCSKESVEPQEKGPQPKDESRYFGLWEPFNEQNYNIRLTEGESTHLFTLEPIGTSLDNAVIRNDTMIVFSGVYEYWMFEAEDILVYSAYAPQPDTAYYFRSE